MFYLRVCAPGPDFFLADTKMVHCSNIGSQKKSYRGRVFHGFSPDGLHRTACGAGGPPPQRPGQAGADSRGAGAGTRPELDIRYSQKKGGKCLVVLSVESGERKRTRAASRALGKQKEWLNRGFMGCGGRRANFYGREVEA